MVLYDIAERAAVGYEISVEAPGVAEHLVKLFGSARRLAVYAVISSHNASYVCVDDSSFKSGEIRLE